MFAVFTDEIGGSSQCRYCCFRERSKAPLLRHIQENHPEQYDFFVIIAKLKGVKVPLNRPIPQIATPLPAATTPQCEYELLSFAFIVVLIESEH